MRLLPRHATENAVHTLVPDSLTLLLNSFLSFPILMCMLIVLSTLEILPGTASHVVYRH